MTLNLISRLPVHTHFRLRPFFWLGLALSGIAVALSIVALLIWGLAFGIDFTGGVQIELQTPHHTIDQARALAENALPETPVSLQAFGENHVWLLKTAQTTLNQDQILGALTETFPKDTVIRRVDYVGPSVGDDLKQKGVIAVVVSMIAIMFYIWVRFEWPFGVSALVALIHDVIITLGFLSLVQEEFSLSTLAAILTIAGYSINDTVVVFDRLREFLKKHQREPLISLAEKTCNHVMVRSCFTGVTTIAALICLYIWGGAALQGFSLAMIVGILAGAYSSIFVATPLMLLLERYIQRTPKAAASVV
jgi:preprotein translocase subunit SecF